MFLLKNKDEIEELNEINGRFDNCFMQGVVGRVIRMVNCLLTAKNETTDRNKVALRASNELTNRVQTTSLSSERSITNIHHLR